MQFKQNPGFEDPVTGLHDQCLRQRFEIIFE